MKALEVAKYLKVNNTYFWTRIMKEDPIPFTVHPVTGRKSWDMETVKKWEIARKKKISS